MSRRDLWDQVDGDLYRVLGVEPDASPDEIQSAWRSTAKRLHPDLGGSVADFQQAEVAYQVLSDPLERGRYDRMRRQSATNYSAATSQSKSRAYAFTYATNTGAWQSGPRPYFDPTSPDPYGDAAANPNRRRRNPWLVALAVFVGIIAGVLAVVLSLVTFLVLFGVAIFIVGRGLTRPPKSDQRTP